MTIKAQADAARTLAPSLARRHLVSAARIVLRGHPHYRELVGGGGAREWAHREAERLADALLELATGWDPRP